MYALLSLTQRLRFLSTERQNTVVHESLIFTLLQWPEDGRTSTTKKERTQASKLQTVVTWHR